MSHMSRLSFINFKRGFNRIAIVFATIVALFGYNFGSDIYVKKNPSEALVFTDEFQSYIKNQYNIEINRIIASKKSHSNFNPFLDKIDDDSIRSILNGYPLLVKATSELATLNSNLTSSINVPEGFVLDTPETTKTDEQELSVLNSQIQKELTQKFNKMEVNQKQIDLYFKHDPLTRFRLDLKIKGQKPEVWHWVHFVPNSLDVIFVGIVSVIGAFLFGYLGMHLLFRLTSWLIEGFKTEN